MPVLIFIFCAYVDVSIIAVQSNSKSVLFFIFI